MEIEKNPFVGSILYGESLKWSPQKIKVICDFLINPKSMLYYLNTMKHPGYVYKILKSVFTRDIGIEIEMKMVNNGKVQIYRNEICKGLKNTLTKLLQCKANNNKTWNLFYELSNHYEFNMRIKTLMDFIKLYNAIKFLKSKGLRSNSNAGLHIHFDLQGKIPIDRQNGIIAKSSGSSYIFKFQKLSTHFVDIYKDKQFKKYHIEICRKQLNTVELRGMKSSLYFPNIMALTTFGAICMNTIIPQLHKCKNSYDINKKKLIQILL